MVGIVGHNLSLEVGLGLILVVLLVMCSHTSSVSFRNYTLVFPEDTRTEAISITTKRGHQELQMTNT